MPELDTSPEADRMQLEVLRRLGPSGRAALTLGMSEDMRRIVRDRIARERPELDERGRVRALVGLPLWGDACDEGVRSHEPMSDSADILRRVAALLDGAGIPFMVAGSFASSVHGKPRTQDLDIVIEVDRKGVAAFVKSLPKDEWYADADAAG